MVEEIENFFIHGEEVFFKAEVEGFSPPNDFSTLCLLPLLVTADSKAHAEIGLTTLQLEGIKDAGVAMCLAHILHKYVIIITAISAIDFETQPRNVLLGIIERMVAEQTNQHQ